MHGLNNGEEQTTTQQKRRRLRSLYVFNKHRIGIIQQAYRTNSATSKLPITINLLANPIQIAALRKIDEDMKSSRCLIHDARFPTEQDRELFVKLIKELGFWITAEYDRSNVTHSELVVEFKRDDVIEIRSIDKLILKLCTIADKFNGMYLGWEPINPPLAYSNLMSELIESRR